MTLSSRRAPRWGVVLHTLSLLVLASPVTAQAVPEARVGVLRGVVRDSAGHAIAIAQIRLGDGHRVAQTHEDGRFAFVRVPAGRWEITALRIGFHPERTIATVAGNDTVEVTFTLHDAAVQLAATVVTGTVGERDAKDALSSVSVLSREKLDRRNDPSVARTIANEPGVYVTSLGPSTARPVIRGLSGDRVVVLEDGARPGDLSSTSADHAVAVSPLGAERVEVVRGPMSLLYGSSALGGVVNVVREEVPRSLPEHIHGQLQTQLTSVTRGAQLGGLVNGGWRGLAWRAEASGRAAGDLHTPAGTLGNTEATENGAAFAVGRASSAGHVGVAYRWFGTSYGLPGGFVGAHPGGVDIDMRRHALRAEGERHFETGRVRSVKATLVQTWYGHEERTASGRIGTSFDQQATALEFVAQQGAWGPFARGAAGFRSQWRAVQTGGSLRTPSTDDWTAGAFVVQEAGEGPLRLQVGARYDGAGFTPKESGSVTVNGVAIPTRPRRFGAFSGSIGTLWAPRSDLRFGVNLSRAFRVPDFNELYSDGPHLAAYSYDVGNPSLDAERGVGLEGFVRLERERLRIEVATYSNRMLDYVFPRNTGELGRQGLRWKYQYVGRDARLAGTEGSIEWTFQPHWVFESTASLVRGRLLGPREFVPAVGDLPAFFTSPWLPLLPPVNGNTGIRYERASWDAGVSTRWAGAQEHLGDFETVTAGYMLLNAHVGVRHLVGERLHALTLRVDNLLDTEYRDHLARTKDVFAEAGVNVQVLYRVMF